MEKLSSYSDCKIIKHVSKHVARDFVETYDDVNEDFLIKQKQENPTDLQVV